MNAIVAVGKNWEIGKDNELLMSIPGDMRFFRRTTTNSVLIMGRKTLESFPHAQPLKNRINIIVTNNVNYQKDPAIIVHSIDEAIREAHKYHLPIFVIGGASIYEQMVPMCDKIYVTKIEKEFPDADAFFPNLDNMSQFKLVEVGDPRTYNSITYRFVTYIRTPAA